MQGLLNHSRASLSVSSAADIRVVSRNCTEDGWSEPFPHYVDACGFDDYDEYESGDQVSSCPFVEGAEVGLWRLVTRCSHQRPWLLLGLQVSPQEAREHLLHTQARHTEGKAFVHSFWAKKHLLFFLSAPSPHHMSPTFLATLPGRSSFLWPSTRRVEAGPSWGPPGHFSRPRLMPVLVGQCPCTQQAFTEH